MAVFPARKLAIAAFATALGMLAPAVAALNRCTDGDGRVTFTERACEAEQEQLELKSRAGNTPRDKPVQHELRREQAPQHESAECAGRRESLARSREQLASVVGLKQYELVSRRVRNNEQYLQKHCR